MESNNITINIESLDNLDLDTFINLLNKKILEQEIIIVNKPILFKERILSKFFSPAVPLEWIQEKNKLTYLDMTEQLEKIATPCATTQSFFYLKSDENDNAAFANEIFDSKDVLKYHQMQAQAVRENKTCTCVELAALAFDTADKILESYSTHKLAVELCTFRNWSHTLLRVSQPQNEHVETRFYDPWYQLVHTNTPKQPKTFLEKNLAQEMQKLFSMAGDFIQPTESLAEISNDNSVKLITNTIRDFTYYVIGSTNEFQMPALEVPDPSDPISEQSYSWQCTIL